MELRQLRYFVEVADREHMTSAAEYLHVAQSAVSLQITKLEAELGVKLFERVGRSVKLTQIGKIFLFHTKKALDAIDYAKTKVDEFLDPEHGTIKIGYPSSLASYFLPTIISSFKQEHPNVAFHLRQGSYSFLINAVKNGEINISFLGPVPTDDNDLHPYVLFTESFSALVPITHPLAKKQSIFLTELKNDDFILFAGGYILRKIVVDACKQAGFAPKIASEGEDLDAIKGLVSAGIGVSILPDNSLYDNVPRLTKKIPIEFPEVKRSVGIIIPQHRELAPSENVFYQFVKGFFSKLERYQ
ncbi:LysR family transcriptional regulator [Caldibacillus lycopersici]|uniref:LysR family transcriptional regulator n=1 Tax=Perspicuibacillus lycopersici TaxID=1325689 RepID=A0AAE3IQJ0_9BACI|nr:LysR family transcriptional regulator [Perspicuibacillus lycopersici]MCU9612556.1 LysR family transcriptional regulator [Perspicuibacillus lycopersici]